MAKKVVGMIKLQVPTGKANPSPPIGPALGQRGLNIMEFCKAFNAQTQNLEPGMPIPVVITAFADRSFTFVTKTPPASYFLKKAAGIEKGAQATGKGITVGRVTMDQIREIAEQKMQDLNANDLDAACRMVIGSARSIGGVDIGAAVIAARQAGLLVKGGGHAMAAGFTVAREHLAAARAFIAERLAARIAAAGIVPTLTLDGALKASGASLALVEHLERVGPFGAGNPEPRFAVPSARLQWADVVGDAHVRCTIAADTGAPLKAIAFRALDGPLGRALLDHGGVPLHLAGRLRLNAWRGSTSVQFQIDDAAKVW